jgi:hypothetical protein
MLTNRWMPGTEPFNEPDTFLSLGQKPQDLGCGFLAKLGCFKAEFRTLHWRILPLVILLPINFGGSMFFTARKTKYVEYVPITATGYHEA